MKITSSQRFAGAIVVMVTLFFVGGCGYKNRPVAPDKIVPKAIEDLQYSIDEKGVKLTWSYPLETIRGTDIVELDSFDLYRAVVPLKDYCANCPIPFAKPIEVAADAISAEERQQANYESTLLRSGHRYFFKVRSRTSWWATSDDSNIVSFVWHVPVKAVSSVVASGGESAVTVRWQPATTLLDGRPVEGTVKYQVLRSLGGKGFDKMGAPITATTYVDSQAQVGKKYFYKIQSLMEFAGAGVSGGVSEPVSGMAVDMTPPPAPTGVTAVKTSKGIKLFWDRLASGEVTSYRVYRRTATEKQQKLIGEVQGVYSIFEDTGAEEAIVYYYAVTAVDNAEPGNESELSQEATIRH